MLWCLNKLWESVAMGKLMPSYGFNIRKKNSSLKIQGSEGAQSLKPQKANPTSEFTIVVLLRLVSRLVSE